MIGYNLVILKDLLEIVGEDRVKSILSDYVCPQNKDVEYFLSNRAIEFEKQGISTTYLIFASHKNEVRLFGYFAIVIKGISVPDKRQMSGNLRNV